MLVLTRQNLEGLKFNLSDGRSVTVHVQLRENRVVAYIDAPLTVRVSRIGRLKYRRGKNGKRTVSSDD